MTIVLLVVACLSLLVSLVAAAGVIGVYDAMAVPGVMGGSGEEPVRVDIPNAIGTQPSRHGLPATLDDQTSVVLVLSPSCPACFDLARAVGTELPGRLHVVVTAADAGPAEEWAARFGIPAHARTIDGEQAIARSLDVKNTPVAIVVEDGQVTGATSVPSVDWLSTLLEEVAA